MNGRRNDDRRDYNNNYHNDRSRDNRNYHDNQQPNRNQYYNNQGHVSRHGTNPLLWVLLGIGGVALAIGGYKLFSASSMAQITNVSPNFVMVEEPYDTCRNVATTKYVANQKNGTTGAIIGGTTGAVAGGIIGNQIRHGGGSVVGAVVGGVGGALIGDQVQKANQPDYIAKHGTAKKCETKMRHVKTQQGFNVQYIYKDQPGSIITQNPPAVGSKIELSQLQAMGSSN